MQNFKTSSPFVLELDHSDCLVFFALSMDLPSDQIWAKIKQFFAYALNLLKFVNFLKSQGNLLCTWLLDIEDYYPLMQLSDSTISSVISQSANTFLKFIWNKLQTRWIFLSIQNSKLVFKLNQIIRELCTQGIFH